MKIGVFDSGLGGHIVAERLELLLPEHEYIVVDDREHVPYGDRSEADIKELTHDALQPLLQETTLIVIACNTATAIAIDWLREQYPHHIFVGFEPMIKPLCELTGEGVILATEGTRNSARYHRLKEKYAIETDIIEPDTTDWALHLENGTPELIDLTELDEAVDNGANVIALACTHYLALEQALIDRYPDATVIEPTGAVARQIMFQTNF